MTRAISVDDEQQVIFDALWQVYRKYDQEESQAAANKKGVLSIIQDLQNAYSCTQPNNHKNHKPSRFETNKRKTTSARDQPHRLSNGRIYYPTFEYKLVEENEHGMRYEMRTPAYKASNSRSTVNVKQTEDGKTMLCIMLCTFFCIWICFDFS